jgi:hypothetical protein
LPPIAQQVAAKAFSAIRTPKEILHYVRDRRRYAELIGAEPLRWRDSLPQLHDRVATSPFDPHYFYQDVWAARHIAEFAPDHHVDVASRVDYVGFLTSICPVTFVDIRPLQADVRGLQSIHGSLLALPFGSESVKSLSCLHVAEHIGLGRYGDELDPLGTRRAAAELQRILAPRGQLLFSVPIGMQRVYFNAYRVHDPRDVPSMFEQLKLVEFCCVGDDGRFHRDLPLEALRDARYACGMFRLVRPTAH